jgi:hypothetical protein
MLKAAAPAADAAADTRWPIYVTVVAVTGAVNAVTGAVTGVTWVRDSALDVTGTVLAVIAVAGCHPPSRRADGPGQVLLATPGSLAHATIAYATEVATALRDTCRYARPSRYPLHRCWSRRWSRASRDPEVVSSFQNVPRPKWPRSPLRHRCQDCALAAARRLVNKSSDRLHRASPLRARPTPGPLTGRALPGSSSRFSGRRGANSRLVAGPLGFV